MTRYVVKPGKTNFKPNEWILPKFGVKGFALEGKFIEGGWCSKEDYSYINDDGEKVVDRDISDWMKLRGLTYWLSRNNKQSIMFAFSYGEEPETYNVTAYTNDKKKGWFNSGLAIVKAGVTFQGGCEMKGDEAIYYFKIENKLVFEVTHPFTNMRTVRDIGTYAGGANNSAGPFGGKAVKRLEIELVVVSI